MHEVDICVIKPLVTIPEIAHVKKCWVDRPKSHAKMVTHSVQYRALFIAAQEFVVQKEGHQGAGMTTIIGNLSYSGVRKLSEAETVANIVLIATASAMCQSEHAENAGQNKEEKDMAAEACESWACWGTISRFAKILEVDCRAVEGQREIG